MSKTVSKRKTEIGLVLSCSERNEREQGVLLSQIIIAQSDRMHLDNALLSVLVRQRRLIIDSKKIIEESGPICINICPAHPEHAKIKEK